MFTGKGEKLGEAQVIQTDPVVGIEQREGIVHGFDRIDQAQAQALDALFVGLPCADVAKRDKGTQTVGAGDDRVFDGEILLPRSLLTGKAPGLHFLPFAPLETGADRASLAIGQNDRVVGLPSQAVGLDPEQLGSGRVDEADPPGLVDAEHAVVGGVENQAVLGHGMAQGCSGGFQFGQCGAHLHDQRSQHAQCGIGEQCQAGDEDQPELPAQGVALGFAQPLIIADLAVRRDQHIAPAKADNLFQRGAEGFAVGR